MLARLKIIKESSKKRCKQSIFWLPNLLTFFNAILGFLSILKAYDGDFITAAYYIIFAAIIDCFDGRLARAMGCSTYFGMELDSLSDAISFCLAPTFLLYCIAPEVNFLGKVILAFYLCAGLGRLAKFNVTCDKQQNEFIGLPTTIAALYISTFVLSQNWFQLYLPKFFSSGKFLFSLVFVISLLMISNIKFGSFKKYKIKLIRDLANLFIFLLALSVGLFYGLPVIFLILTCYILYFAFIFSFRN